MNRCPVCQNGALKAVKFACGDCGLSFEGQFGRPPLSRLQGGEAHLAEQLILCGGNLKQLAADLGITYPTLRKRLDGLIGTLKHMRDEDEAEIGRILSAMEGGEVAPNEGLRLIKEMRYEA